MMAAAYNNTSLKLKLILVTIGTKCLLPNDRNPPFTQVLMEEKILPGYGVTWASLEVSLSMKLKSASGSVRAVVVQHSKCCH